MDATVLQIVLPRMTKLFSWMALGNAGNEYFLLYERVKKKESDYSKVFGGCKIIFDHGNSENYMYNMGWFRPDRRLLKEDIINAEDYRRRIRLTYISGKCALN